MHVDIRIAGVLVYNVVYRALSPRVADSEGMAEDPGVCIFPQAFL